MKIQTNTIRGIRKAPFSVANIKCLLNIKCSFLNARYTDNFIIKHNSYSCSVCSNPNNNSFQCTQLFPQNSFFIFIYENYRKCLNIHTKSENWISRTGCTQARYMSVCLHYELFWRSCASQEFTAIVKCGIFSFHDD